MNDTNAQTFTEFVLNYLTKGKISKTDYNTESLTNLLMKCSQQLHMDYSSNTKSSVSTTRVLMQSIAVKYLETDNV